MKIESGDNKATKWYYRKTTNKYLGVCEKINLFDLINLNISNELPLEFSFRADDRDNDICFQWITKAGKDIYLKRTGYMWAKGN